MKILIADDHGVFRDGLKFILADLDPALEVIEAATFDAVVSAVERHDDLDLILLDLYMPGVGGGASAAAVCTRVGDVPVIVLSASDRLSDMRQSFDAGARGYILKSESGSVMLAAIRLVLSGGIYVPPKLVRAAQHEGRNPEQMSIHVTDRQLDVLRLIIDGYSNKQIAHQLGLTEATVKAHVSAAFKALNVSNRTQAAAVARQMGLCEA